jgi:acyl dehydratase
MAEAPDSNPLSREVPFKVGERFTRELHFTADAIRKFAEFVGDTNPLHHDEKLARDSRFGRLIASGTHTSALMMAANADYVTARSPSLGLEISCRLRRAVCAGDTLQLEWVLTAIEPKASLGGSILTFNATLTNAQGEIAATGWAKSLVPWKKGA